MKRGSPESNAALLDACYAGVARFEREVCWESANAVVVMDNLFLAGHSDVLPQDAVQQAFGRLKKAAWDHIDLHRKDPGQLAGTTPVEADVKAPLADLRAERARIVARVIEIDTAIARRRADRGEIDAAIAERMGRKDAGLGR